MNSLHNYQHVVRTHHDDILLPPEGARFANINTDSCFNIKKFVSHGIVGNDLDFSHITVDDSSQVKTKFVKMFPTLKQHDLLQNWFSSYILMYNATIRFIKKKISFQYLINYKDQYIQKYRVIKLISTTNTNIRILNNQVRTLQTKLNSRICWKTAGLLDVAKKKLRETKVKLNTFKQQKASILNKINEMGSYVARYSKRNRIRTYDLKVERDNLISSSGLNDGSEIKTHMMDCAIQQACSNYKSCISNFLSGEIRQFRVRYWRMNKNIKLLDIEPCYIRNNQICEKILGKIEYKYNKKPYKLTSSQTVKIRYDKECNEYSLLVPINIDIDDARERHYPDDYIGLDQGNKTLVTGVSKKGAIKIGTNLNSKIKSTLRKIDKINNDVNGKFNNKPKLQKLKEAKYYRNIKNMVDETHWKTIQFLTDHYSTIIIGNLSTKRISQLDTDPMTKRVGFMLKHSVFRKRLAYKCAVLGIKLKVVNEAYTTKVCSECSHYNGWVTNEDEIECHNCGIFIIRDINGARGILMLGIKH